MMLEICSYRLPRQGCALPRNDRVGTHRNGSGNDPRNDKVRIHCNDSGNDPHNDRVEVLTI